MLSTRTDGWPKDSGPLKTLFDLGLIPHPAARPGWLKYPKCLTDTTGAIVYKGSAKYVTTDALRALAALTFEGWDVFLNVAPGELDIKIFQTTNRTN